MALSESLIIKGVGLIVDFVNRQLGAERSKKVPQKEFDRILNDHVMGAFRWSETFQMLGMDSPMNTINKSVPLNIGTIPRRFKTSKTKNNQCLDETALLNSPSGFVILGDPGAGKTTTLKRLIQTFAAAPVGEMDFYQLPVLVRLREFRNKDNIYQIIAESIGFPVSVDNEKSGKTIQIWNEDIRSFIHGFLDNSRAVVFIDGLDEIPESEQKVIASGMECLAQTLQHAKLILTCRSGEYRRMISNLQLVEIEPLNDRQIRELAAHFVSKPHAFLKAVKRLPYSDVVDRPLLLSHLLFMYKRNAELPEQPCILYRKLVRVLLQEWDEERGIVRKSRYAQFDPDTKMEFLSAFAFHLTYVTKAKHFTTSLLEESYCKIRFMFNLPSNEAAQVVREIESHTGLIVECGDGFEFSHLSIQEFLAANYIVRAPHSDILRTYLEQFPSPVAVAITLSSAPSKWFAGLLLNRKISEYFTRATFSRLLKNS